MSEGVSGMTIEIDVLYDGEDRQVVDMALIINTDEDSMCNVSPLPFMLDDSAFHLISYQRQRNRKADNIEYQPGNIDYASNIVEQAITFRFAMKPVRSVYCLVREVGL
jgi:hypothetical protein